MWISFRAENWNGNSTEINCLLSNEWKYMLNLRYNANSYLITPILENFEQFKNFYNTSSWSALWLQFRAHSLFSEKSKRPNENVSISALQNDNSQQNGVSHVFGSISYIIVLRISHLAAPRPQSKFNFVKVGGPKDKKQSINQRLCPLMEIKSNRTLVQRSNIYDKRKETKTMQIVE